MNRLSPFQAHLLASAKSTPAQIDEMALKIRRAAYKHLAPIDLVTFTSNTSVWAGNELCSISVRTDKKTWPDGRHCEAATLIIYFDGYAMIVTRPDLTFADAPLLVPMAARYAALLKALDITPVRLGVEGRARPLTHVGWPRELDQKAHLVSIDMGLDVGSTYVSKVDGSRHLVVDTTDIDRDALCLERKGDGSFGLTVWIPFRKLTNPEFFVREKVNTSPMPFDEYEALVYRTRGVAAGQVYRSVKKPDRYLTILTVRSKFEVGEDKPRELGIAVASCNRQGKKLGQTVRMLPERITDRSRYTLVKDFRP